MFPLFSLLIFSELVMAHQPVPPNLQPGKITHYAPPAVGAKCVYEYTTTVPNDPPERIEVTRVLTAIEEKNGARLLSIGIERNKKIVPECKLNSTAQGLSYVSFGDTSLRTPICMLRLPHKSGNKWTTKLPWEDGLELEVEGIDCGEEEIEVPAGKYVALRVELECIAKRKLMRAVVWYAPGIGPVKAILKLGDTETTICLKSFTQDKK